MMIAAVSAVVYGLLLGSAQAAKDDSYYIAGTGNPNVDEKMYWKDAENVFQDLSQFSSLYVEFHNCAWSWMQTSDEDNDIDENDYWYLGKIPPMGANVAYSLYGSLKGESFEGCSQNTFINSFYTNSGFSSFAQAMNYAGKSGFSSYTSKSSSCSGGYGIGCDYSNGFAVHTYSGDECDPADYSGVKDKMSNLNSAMKSAQCVQIYDSSSYSGSPYGTALQLLAYSHSCFYQDFFSPDGICPDPYGKLANYQQQFYKGIQESKKQDPYQVSQRKEVYNQEIRNGKIMSFAGVCLAALACIIFFFELVVACFGRKEDSMRKFVPRQQDFIITRRSKDEDDLESTPTVADKSDTSSENYVTMSNEAYSPPVNVADKIDAPSDNYVTMLNETYNPPVNVAPTVVPPPQLSVAPTVIPPPQLTVAPTVVPPPQLSVAPSPPPQPKHAPTAIPPPQVAVVPTVVPGVDVAPESEAPVPAPQVVIAPTVVPPPQPGSEMKVSVMDQDEPVTVYAPPSIMPKEPVPEKMVIADVKEQEEPVTMCAPPSVMPKEPVPGKMVIADVKDQEEPVTLYAPPSSAREEPVQEKVTIADVKDTEAPPAVMALSTAVVAKAAAKTESPKLEESTPAEKEAHSTTATETSAPQETETVKENETAIEPKATEPTSSALPEEAAPEPPALAEARSLISLSEVEDPMALFADIRGSSSELASPEESAIALEEAPVALFAGIRGSSSELASPDDIPAEDDSIPSIDEIVASREFDTDSDNDDDTKAQTHTLIPEHNNSFMNQSSAPVSEYFDTLETDDVEQSREGDEAPTPFSETKDTATEGSSTAAVAPEETETEDKSASWFGFGS